MSDNPIVRMLRGQRAARERALALVAVAEAIAATAALAVEGKFPGPRDPISERGVEQVRQRWARIERRAREAQEG